MVHNKPQSKELLDRARGKGAIRADYMLLDGGFDFSEPPFLFAYQKLTTTLTP
ncbi:hypothetical protein [Acutalibacter intestini]|uniref:hypothetical protein n=1 Tax=Acutalibacter intestini TaxID=3093659 RepID=UPI002AC99AE3|nr:hypothetical protein [Acutalibacter sp. M00204]